METVEAGPGTVRRITPSGCERRPGRSNGGQRSWSLAAGGLACAQHRIAQCLLRLARASTIDCETYRLTRRTAGCGPACPVVWEGRSCEASPYPDQLGNAVERIKFIVRGSGPRLVSENGASQGATLLLLRSSLRRRPGCG